MLGKLFFKPHQIWFKVYARWLGGQRELCGSLASLKLGGRGGGRRHVEQHRLPGKQLILGTGKQWWLGTEPHWEEAQQQGSNEGWWRRLLDEPHQQTVL